MANTPESKVKRKVTDILNKYNAYFFYPPSNGFGRAGIPDIIVCYCGQFIAIECKAGKNTTTALQRKELRAIEDAGGYALVINETNIDQVDAVLHQIKEAHHDRQTTTNPLA